MSALRKFGYLLRYPTMFRRAYALAGDDQAFVQAMTKQPFTPGDRVKHGFLGWVGTVDSLRTHDGSRDGMVGVLVVWDDPEVYEGPVDEPLGTPVWYPAMALSKVS